MHSSRTRHDSTKSTPKVCVKRRTNAALGHSRGRRYHGSTLATKGTAASSLWDSGTLLFLEQPSSGIPQPTHVT